MLTSHSIYEEKCWKIFIKKSWFWCFVSIWIKIFWGTESLYLDLHLTHAWHAGNCFVSKSMMYRFPVPPKYVEYFHFENTYIYIVLIIRQFFLIINAYNENISWFFVVLIAIRLPHLGVLRIFTHFFLYIIMWLSLRSVGCNETMFFHGILSQFYGSITVNIFSLNLYVMWGHITYHLLWC